MAQLRSGRRPYSSVRWQHVLSVLVALFTVYLFQHRSMVPPPASCGEERHMCASRLIVTPVLLPAVFSGIAPGQVIAATAFLAPPP